MWAWYCSYFALGGREGKKNIAAQLENVQVWQVRSVKIHGCFSIGGPLFDCAPPHTSQAKEEEKKNTIEAYSATFKSNPVRMFVKWAERWTFYPEKLKFKSRFWPFNPHGENMSLTRTPPPKILNANTMLLEKKSLDVVFAMCWSKC